MQVLVNSNHSISVTADLEERVKATVETELERFDDHLTRVEVHLNDENSSKSGPHDKRCQMEARVKGHDPSRPPTRPKRWTWQSTAPQRS